jgi:predicted transcriptional regulator YdeE
VTFLAFKARHVATHKENTGCEYENARDKFTRQWQRLNNHLGNSKESSQGLASGFGTCDEHQENEDQIYYLGCACRAAEERPKRGHVRHCALGIS